MTRAHWRAGGPAQQGHGVLVCRGKRSIARTSWLVGLPLSRALHGPLGVPLGHAVGLHVGGHVGAGLGMDSLWRCLRGAGFDSRRSAWGLIRPGRW